MKLKKPDIESGEYNLEVCSVQGCNNRSEIVYDTKKLAQVRYAFCDKHHKEKCDEEEKEWEKAQVRPVLRDEPRSKGVVRREVQKR